MLYKKAITTSSFDHYIEFASRIDLNLVAGSSFNELYDTLLKLSHSCIIEIKTNLTIIDGGKRNDYIEFVKKEIEYNFNFNKSNKLLDTYIMKYDLIIDDFPFSNNVDIKHILSENYSVGNSTDVTMVKDMHFDFFRYAILIETNKILEIINENLSGVSIFKSNNSKLIFEELLKFFNIRDHKKRGNQAKLAAIWQCKSSRDIIFKASVSKREYLKYLNSIFHAHFTTKSFSIGDNHESIVEKWIKENCL